MSSVLISFSKASDIPVVVRDDNLNATLSESDLSLQRQTVSNVHKVLSSIKTLNISSVSSTHYKTSLKLLTEDNNPNPSLINTRF